MKVFKLFVLGLSIFIISCYKPVYETIPSQSPKLVVNSLFSPDSVFTVYVARSRSFNDQLRSYTILWVNDAVCSLFVDGSFLQVLQNTGNGRYVSPDGYKPQVGRHYKTKVWHRELGEAEADIEAKV